MKTGVLALCSVLPIAVAVWYFSRVDQRPLPVKVVPAFPHLEWPDWLLGIDEGFHREPRPLLLVGAADGHTRIFVGTQFGTVHVCPNNPDSQEIKTFLDVRDRIPAEERGGEEGFLGLPFHPHYKQNAQFFVYYSEKPTTVGAHTS